MQYKVDKFAHSCFVFAFVFGIMTFVVFWIAAYQGETDSVITKVAFVLTIIFWVLMWGATVQCPTGKGANWHILIQTVVACAGFVPVTIYWATDDERLIMWIWLGEITAVGVYTLYWLIYKCALPGQVAPAPDNPV